MTDHALKIACPICKSINARLQFGGERGEAGPFVYCPDCDYDEEAGASVQVVEMAAPVHTDQEYLGDGVYASFDGWKIWLAADDHRNVVIALEPVVFERLIEYRDKLAAKHSAQGKRKE